MTDSDNRICSYDFTDIYVSEVSGEVALKGLAEAQTDKTDGKSYLSPPPEAARADIERLKKELFQANRQRVVNKDEVSFSFDYDDTRFRASVIDSVNGRWITLRKINPPKRLNEFTTIPIRLRRSLMELGMNGSYLRKTPPLSGLVLVNGPTGSGKTTFSAALLQEWLINYGGVATTAEDPPEINFPQTYLDGKGRIFQLEVKNGDFATACQNMMRYSPRYILLGEVRDSRAADQAIRAAVNGHLVLTTIHAGTIVEAINTLVRLSTNGGRHLLAQGLRAVIDLRLTNRPGGERQIDAESLLIPPTSKGNAMQNLIANEQTSGQLISFIDQQKKLIAVNKPPVSWYEQAETRTGSE